MIDDHVIAKVALYAKQHQSKYCGKPGKQLACVLFEDPSKPSCYHNEKSQQGVNLEFTGNTSFFSDYYLQLYSTFNPMEEECESFLKDLYLPKTDLEHLQVLDSPMIVGEIIN